MNTLPVGTRVKLRLTKYRADGRYQPDERFTKYDVGTIVPNGYVSWDTPHKGSYSLDDGTPNCWSIDDEYLREVKGV